MDVVVHPLRRGGHSNCVGSVVLSLWILGEPSFSYPQCAPAAITPIDEAHIRSIHITGRLAVTLCLALAGCAASPRCPPLPGGPDYCLQDSGAVPAFNALHDIRLRRQGFDERLIAQLEVDADGMRLAGLTPMGQRVLEARFDNVAATASSLADGRLDARAALAGAVGGLARRERPRGTGRRVVTAGGGWGAATLVLEELEHARARGATIYAEIVGFGCSSDGSHITQPEAATMAVAMDLALKDAGLPPSAIGYVNAFAPSRTVRHHSSPLCRAYI